MLPSMPILFSRESHDGFDNKTQPSTSFFSQNSSPKLVTHKPVTEAPPVSPKKDEAKNKIEPEKKKSDPPINDDNALENAFIRSYYHRVQSRFSSNMSMPMNKFILFQNLLKNFNPKVETPADLYRKIEELFGKEHKDIVEDFLLFLKPGQAVEVGRFTDRFQLVQITGFINMLHTTFARKPTVLRKVLRALTNALNNGAVEEAKARLLPHLRSNPRLTQRLKSLFPDERPPDSLYESGVDVANESFLTSDKGCDVWEFDETENKRKLGNKEELDTMYMNGRVFLQHGRLLRSARVTYPYSKEPYRVHARRLAPVHCHPTPPDSDEETRQKQPKNNTPKRTRKPTKSPTKKDVNDNTKNNCQVSLNNSSKPKKAQKTKNCKKESNCGVQKRERKDSKHATMLKKDVDAPKTKQARIEAPENVEVPMKDARNNFAFNVEAKIVVPVNSESKNDASANEIAKIEASVGVEAKNIQIKSNNWTRDEDKTMLQVLKGEAGSEKVFGRIRELLPHRSATEIKERFCHVMTLLQQMAVSEVT